MAVLGVDTSTASTSVGVVIGERTLTLAEVSNKPGESLGPLVDEILRSGGLVPGDLEAIGVGLGPGPFTGLRVGIVFAAAMGHALKIPVFGRCSLDTMLANGVAVSDARRKEVYWARYREGERVDGPHVSTPADLVPLLSAGEPVVGTRAHAELLGTDSEAVEFPSALAHAAWAKEQLALGAAPTELTPLYLRRPDAEESFAPKSVLT